MNRLVTALDTMTPDAEELGLYGGSAALCRSSGEPDLSFGHTMVPLVALSRYHKRMGNAVFFEDMTDEVKDAASVIAREVAPSR